MLTESGTFVQTQFNRPCMAICDPTNVERAFYHCATQTNTTGQAQTDCWYLVYVVFNQF